MKKPALAKIKKQSKYNAIRTRTNDGFLHASKKEAERWLFLKALEAKGIIRDLRRQVRHTLTVNGVKVGTYISDHEFVWANTGQFQCEDVKSPRTAKLPLFRRNKRHMMAEFGIDVIEVFKYNA